MELVYLFSLIAIGIFAVGILFELWMDVCEVTARKEFVPIADKTRQIRDYKFRTR